MSVVALAVSRDYEYVSEGQAVYDSIGECVGWVGQTLEESGYPCEHMGMGDEGYTSCWSSSEISRLKVENEHLRDTMSQMAYDHAEQTREVRALRVENEQMRKLLDFCSEYIADDRCEGCVIKHPCYEGDIDDCWMKVQLMRMMNDLGIEVR